MKTGISVYFGSGMQTNEEVIARARKAGAAMAFTSLHIPEEVGVDYAHDARALLRALHEAGIGLIADVGPRTVGKLGCSRVEELADLGITHVRLDYGFSPDDTVRLSHTFHIVVNASTVSREDIRAWDAAGADFTRFSACHNYYPKRWTALSLDKVREMNARLSMYGFETIGFVPGDGELRGPLYEGLPTVEAHRDRSADLALNALELAFGAGCDVVLVGDVGLTDASWDRLGQLSSGYVDVRCDLDGAYGYLYGQVHHDRPDSSPWVFRSQESRTSLRPSVPVQPDAHAGGARRAGSIAVSNSGYGRYEGELEIARGDIPGDERMNVVGSIHPEDMRLLPFIRDGFGLRLV